ncbi:hypothetical protein D3C76_985280 [compost metagenome]
MPKLLPSAVKPRRCTSRCRRSAICQARSGGQPGSRAANSSPPIRPNRSPRRRALAPHWAMRCSTWSPTWWPWVSLICLKSSISSRMKASGLPYCTACSNSRWAHSKKCRRLLLWVSTSVVARRWSSPSSCFFSVMSSAMPTTMVGCSASPFWLTKHLSLIQRNWPSARMMRYSRASMAPFSSTSAKLRAA